jgi:DNA modification methylase
VWTVPQYGLEATVEDYVARLVDVFSQVRRVLKPTGTLWVNLGDTYTAPDKKAGPFAGASGELVFCRARSGRAQVQHRRRR